MASFADYVKDLMGVLPQVNGNPMLSVTSMTDDNARYREDPFYRSREIQARDQLVLDEEERRRREAALSGSGMMTGNSGGDSGVQPLDPSIEAMLNAENMGARGVRNNAFMAMIGGDRSASNISQAMGLTDSLGLTTAGRMAQMANQYSRTPDFLKGLLPQSYANAAGFINQSDSIFGGMNPNGFAAMGAQQAAMLAAQDEGLFATPEERAAFYADSGGDSGSSGGGGMTGSGGYGGGGSLESTYGGGL
jgi:hypothetical protein